LYNSLIKLENNFNIVAWKIITFLIIEAFVIVYIILQNQLVFALIVFILAILAALIVFNSQLGFLLILFIQYSSILIFFSEGKGHYFRYFALLVMSIWMLNKLIRKDLTIETDKFQILIIIYWLIILFSHYYALDQIRSLAYIWTSATIFVIFFGSFIDVFNTEKNFKWVFRIILLSMFFLSIIGLYFYIKNFEIVLVGLMEKRLARTSSFMNDPNHYAIALVTMLPFSMYYVLIAKSKFLKILLVIGILLVMFSIFITFSRGALVSLFIMILYMLYREKKLKMIMSFIIGIILITSIITIFFPFMLEYFGQRIEMLTSGGDMSVSLRLLVLKGGINMFLDHPFLGVGAGNFIVYSRAYSFLSEAKFAHNSFLEIGAELGVFGLTLFVLIIVLTIINLKKSQDEFIKKNKYEFYWMARSIEIGLIGLLVGSAFLSRSNDPYLWSIVSFSVILKKLSLKS